MLCSSRAPRASLLLALRGCCSSRFCLRFVSSPRLRSAFGRQWGRFCSLFPAVGVPHLVGSPPARARGSVRSGASGFALRPSAHPLAFLRPLFTSQLRSAVFSCLALRSVLMPPSASLRPPCSLRSPPPPDAGGLSSVKNFSHNHLLLARSGCGSGALNAPVPSPRPRSVGPFQRLVSRFPFSFRFGRGAVRAR